LLYVRSFDWEELRNAGQAEIMRLTNPPWMCYDHNLTNHFSGMDIRIPLADIKELLPEAEICGTARPEITGIASLEDASYGDLSFVASAKFLSRLNGCSASVVLVPTGSDVVPAPDQVFIAVEDPSLAISRVCELVDRMLSPRPSPGIHARAIVDPSAHISPDAYIGPNCIIGPDAHIAAGVYLEANVFVGRGVLIGKDCHLQPGVVVLDRCRLGERVRLQSGVVLGGDGFGYIQVGKLPDLYHHKVPQIGIVVIDDDVEIGTNTTIDRARFGETRIGEGTKIDNLVQIAHNVTIGRRCIICAHVGISGSTTIGDYVVIWGQAGIVGHINVGNGAFIGGQAGVTKDVAPGGKITGTPARSFYEQRKIDALLGRIPELFHQNTVSNSGLEGQKQ